MRGNEGLSPRGRRGGEIKRSMELDTGKIIHVFQYADDAVVYTQVNILNSNNFDTFIGSSSSKIFCFPNFFFWEPIF